MAYQSPKRLRLESMSSLEHYEIRVQPAKKHFGPKEEAYQNSASPRGCVFLGNYDKIKRENKIMERPGSATDVSQLRELFTQMNYKIMSEIHEGTKSGTLEALKRFRDLDEHESAESMILIIMSHGKGNSFYTSDGKLIHFKKVCNMFSNENCPRLHGKPKLFLFQFCRKGKEMEDYRPKLDSSLSSAMICLATSEGNYAFRHNECGTILFYYACRMIMDHAKDKDFDCIHKKICRKLPKEQKSELRAIDVEYALYFNPPLESDIQPANPALCSRICDETIQDRLSDVDTGGASSSACLMTDGLDSVSDGTDYELSTSPGLVLVINNLGGCANDMEELSRMFSKLGFEVLTPKTNVTYKEFMTQVNKFKQKEHHEAAIIVFYGQGSDDYLVTSDGILISHVQLLTLFNDRNCHKLSGKPKLFIFNVISTDDFTYPPQDHFNDHPGHSNDMAFGEDDNDDDNEEAEKDMMLFNVIVENGNCEDGSLLTDALANILLDPQHERIELEPLLRLVMRKLSILSEGKSEKYFSTKASHRFQKCFYFVRTGKHDQADASNDFDIQKQCCDIQKPPMPRIPSLRISKVVKTGSDRIYENTSTPKGKAIIIGFSEYEPTNIPNCNWRKEETTKLKQLAKELGYDPIDYDSVTYDKLTFEMKRMKKEPGFEGDHSVLVSVSGFAPDINNFYDRNGEHIPVFHILHHFTDEQCPAMKGKPKIIFLHMTPLGKWQKKIMLSKTLLNSLKDTFLFYLISNPDDPQNNQSSRALVMLFKAIESKAADMDFASIIMDLQEELMAKGQGVTEKIIFNPINVNKDLYLNPLHRNKRLCRHQK